MATGRIVGELLEIRVLDGLSIAIMTTRFSAKYFTASLKTRQPLGG